MLNKTNTKYIWVACFLTAWFVTKSTQVPARLLEAAKYNPSYRSHYIYNSDQYPYSYILSEPLDILPQGYSTLFIGDEVFYYYEGLFYQRSFEEQKYVRVPPPIGAIVPALPEEHQLTYIDGVYLYEHNGVFYKRTLTGFKVVRPPSSIVVETAISEIPYFDRK